MTPVLNHIGIPARNKETAATFLAHIMGLRYEGVDPHADVSVVRVNDSLMLQFYDAEQVQMLHLAFHITEEEFDAVLARLQAAALPYGNDPEAPENGLTEHVWGGRGVYFRDPDGHFFEVLTQVEG